MRECVAEGPPRHSDDVSPLFANVHGAVLEGSGRLSSLAPGGLRIAWSLPWVAACRLDLNRWKARSRLYRNTDFGEPVGPQGIATGIARR
jgi:hypothetical protein